MSYRKDRDQFINRMTQEGLPFRITEALLRAATTKHRIAELLCSSEAADRDRVPCPASPIDLKGRPRKPSGPCCCDYYSDPTDTHKSVPRIAAQDERIDARLKALMPAGWSLDIQGDPRGYVLRVIPPSYAERNSGRRSQWGDLDSIGVPSGPTRIHW